MGTNSKIALLVALVLATASAAAAAPKQAVRSDRNCAAAPCGYGPGHRFSALQRLG